MRFVEGSTFAEVTFRQGWVYDVRDGSPENLLATILEDEQLLQKGAGEASFVVAHMKGVRHGDHLVSSGVLSKDSLVQALAVQVKRKLATVFTMSDEATFAFFEKEVIVASDSVSLDPITIAWQGLRQRPPWEQIRALTERLGSARLALNSTSGLARFGFTGEEAAACQLLQRGPLSLSELIDSGQIGANSARVFVYALLIAKQVTVQPATGVSPNLTPPQPAVSPANRTSMPTPQSIAVRSFSPSASGSFSDRAPSSSRSPTTSLSPAPSSVRVPPSTLTPEERARAEAIAKRASVVEKQDYFQMLGVPQSADAAAIGQAYFVMAKEWHPDRLPRALEYIKTDCARVFSLCSEAHRTLLDPAQRAKYMEMLRQGSGTPEAQKHVQDALEAVGMFARAEVYLKTRDYQAAEPLLANVVSLDSKQADYLAALAWARSQLPEHQSKEATQKQIEALSNAVEMNEKCERAYMYRAQLYRRLDNPRSAYRDFVTVTELNPRNVDALREVRLFNMRGKPVSVPPAKNAPESKEQGLLSKFFKK
jgi:hypothetical protein